MVALYGMIIISLRFQRYCSGALRLSTSSAPPGHLPLKGKASRECSHDTLPPQALRPAADLRNDAVRCVSPQVTERPCLPLWGRWPRSGRRGSRAEGLFGISWYHKMPFRPYGLRFFDAAVRNPIGDLPYGRSGLSPPPTAARQAILLARQSFSVLLTGSFPGRQSTLSVNQIISGPSRCTCPSHP